MRVIHTSDWHLGQHFIGKSRLNEHRAFLHWLLEQVTAYQVDAIIVAGDVFDTGSPPSYARQLYNQFVVDLQPSRCQLVVLGGNHDSVATLNESTKLLACLNTRVIAGVQAEPADQLLVLNDAGGKPGAIVCAIPFIRPRDVLDSQAGQSGSDKQQALQQAISDHYAAIYQLALQKRREFDSPLPIIATGHLTAVGVTTSDSVREIYIGTLEAFPANAFPPADYIALGHIHRAQIVAKSDHIRYSGSPIPLSFDEVGKAKSVCLVEFSATALVKVETLEVPLFQPMQLIKGDLATIENALQAFAESKPESEPEKSAQQEQEAQQDQSKTADVNNTLPVWLDIEVSSEDYLSDLQKRIETLTEGLPVEVLLLRRERVKQQNTLTREAKETLNELNPQQVFEKRLDQECFDGDADKARLARIRNTFKVLVAESIDAHEHEEPVAIKEIKETKETKAAVAGVSE